MPTLIASTLVAGAVCAHEPTIIADFSSDDTLAWQTVNDGVMGGLSRGGFERTERGTLLFRGETSLENNGGFSSIRTRPKNLGLSSKEGLVLRLKADARKYKVALRTAGTGRWIAYWADIETVPGEWMEVKVPFSAWVPTSFGRKLPGPKLDLARIDSVGFMLYDKQAGPFSLEVDWIGAYEQHDHADSAQTKTIVGAAQGAGTFKTLLAAAKAAGLVEALSGAGPLTVFAPTDAAFAALPEGTVESLLRPENKAQLVAVLKYHVVSGRVTLRDLLIAGKGTTLQGAELTAGLEDSKVKVGTATISTADIACSNGVIHVVDSVLLPPQPVAQQPEQGSRPLAARARSVIELAIQRGVPLFNAGQENACQAIYEIAVASLLDLDDELLSEALRERLRVALVRPEGPKAGAEHAWTLRRALDAAYAELGRAYK